MNRLKLVGLLLCITTTLFAQVPTQPQQAQVQTYLADRDIDEEELRQRLADRGIYLNNLTPGEVTRLRPQIEAVIAEMEQEKAQATKTANDAAAKSTKEIQRAVEDGASVEEAVTEVATEAVSEALPDSDIYGHQIFRNKSLQVYRATKNVTPPNSYPLKVGDEIAVSIFGASQTDFILRLDDEGFVKLPRGYKMSLGGIPLGDARTLLANRLRQFYTFGNGQLSIRIQAARTISVNIFGEVENNGSFSMSSINTGFNALVAAGGPTDNGTVRNIQLNQGDKTTILDVYEYLKNPTEGTALFLNNNATIFVPLAEKIITLRGGVQRPLRYELKENEGLSDLLEFAGGTRVRAETRSIQVTRYVAGALELINVDLNKNPDFVLLDEDEVNVPVIADPVENYVTIEGAVLLPGRYPYDEKITLADLLARGRLRPGARTDVAFLFRNNENGTKRLLRVKLGADAGAEQVVLQRGDVLRVLAERTFTDQSTFTVSGAVRDNSITLPFPQDGALTLEEAVLLAGGTKPNAAPEVMLIRTLLENREEIMYERLDIRTNGDFELLPFDRIQVYYRERFSDAGTVSIEGAVRQPGSFPFSGNLSFRDLLYLGGGLRIDAATNRIEVFRLKIDKGVAAKTLLTTLSVEDIDSFTLQPFDEIIVRSAAEFEKIQNIFVKGEVRYPGKYALLKGNERLSEIVSRAGGITTEAFPAGATLRRQEKDIGYVVLDLDQILKDEDSPANMVLLPGDTLYIPKKNELVTIYTSGTLANRFGIDSINTSGVIQVAFQGNRRADWYIDNYAGGFSDNARPRWTTVEYASGRVKETKHFLLTERYPRLAPGAQIRVGLKPPKVQKQRREERFDWIEFASVVLGAATTITTFILLRQP